MSLKTFQRLAVDLTLSPALARAVKNGTDPLLNYDLTPRERRRLVDITRQPGISIHCTLSRGNRFEMIANTLPMTCALLAKQLRGLLELHCQRFKPANYQLFGDEVAFAEMIVELITEGELEVEYLQDVVGYELLCHRLATSKRLLPIASQSVSAEFKFCYDPKLLLPPLSRRQAPPPGLPKTQYTATVYLGEDGFRVVVND